jgi:hypothetical protein
MKFKYHPLTGLNSSLAKAMAISNPVTLYMNFVCHAILNTHSRSPISFTSLCTLFSPSRKWFENMGTDSRVSVPLSIALVVLDSNCTAVVDDDADWLPS